MKNIVAVLIAVFVLFAAVPSQPVFAAGVEYKQTALDNAWDWWTTLGKEGLEKERILAENKAERLKRWSEKHAAQMKKDAEKAGADMKKKLGL